MSNQIQSKPKMSNHKSHVDSKHKAHMEPKHGSKKVKSLKSTATPAKLKELVGLAKPLFARREMALAEKKEFDAKYVSVDTKGNASNPVDDRLKLIDMEIDALKKVARATFGGSHVAAKLVQSTVYASTVTTGVVNGVFSLIANNFSDFAALAGIFEEYKMHKGVYEFLPTLAASSATGVVNNGSQFGCISYNPVIAASGVSAAFLADDTQHMIFMPAQVYLNVQAAIGVPARPDKFHFRIPKGVIDDATVVSGGQWLSCANLTTPFGYIRVYMIAASTTVIANAINGLLSVDFEFRMRV